MNRVPGALQDMFRRNVFVIISRVLFRFRPMGDEYVVS